MKGHGKVIFALIVSFLMVVSVIPIQNSDDICAEGGELSVSGTGQGSWRSQLSESDKEVKTVDNGDGTYRISIPFLEDMFGMEPRDPDPRDPTYGTMGILLPEIHSYFGNNTRNTMLKPDGEEAFGGPTISNGIARGVEFSAGFSNNYLKTGVEDIFVYGITNDGRLFIQNTTNTDAHFKDADDSDYLKQLLTEYTNVSMMQSSNLLNYAVGDFIPDPFGKETEEFALYLGDHIEIYDCVDEEKDYMWPVMSMPVHDRSMYPVFSNSSFGYRVTPVSMTAGDTDGDGMDEVVMSIEYGNNYSNPERYVNAQHESYLFIMDPGSGEVETKEI